jgi:hypothetical protein
VPEDRYKMPFAMDWGNYQYIVMSFRLKNALAVFSRVVVTVFKKFIHHFLEAYIDDWTVFSLLKDHIETPRLMLDQCRQCQTSLNLKKCIFDAPFMILIGHIVCNQGLLVDPTKITFIQEAIIPMEFLIPSLRIATMTDPTDSNTIEERLSQLLILEEYRLLAGLHQQVQKA